MRSFPSERKICYAQIENQSAVIDGFSVSTVSGDKPTKSEGVRERESATSGVTVYVWT